MHTCIQLRHECNYIQLHIYPRTNRLITPFEWHLLDRPDAIMATPNFEGRPKFDGSMESHYDVLGVSVSADVAEIRRAFHARSRQVHPDKNTENELHAEELMKAVNKAYEVLSDSIKRAEHDDDLAKKGHQKRGDFM